MQWAKKLADNDKAVREKTVTILEAFLSKQSQSSELELLKLWKGLFYCMWMSDKRPVQHELAIKISQMIASVHPNRKLAFIKAFFDTMHREWAGIDRLRLDKFYFFLGQFLLETAKALNAIDWDEESVTTFATDLRNGPLSAKLEKGMGFKYSVVEKFWPMMQRGSGSQGMIPPEAIGILLEPFLYLMARGKDKTLVDRIEKHIFEPLLPGKEEEAVPLVCDIESVMKRVFEWASAKGTQERNRGRLYAIHTKLEQWVAMLKEMGMEEDGEPPSDEDGIDEEFDDGDEGEEEVVVDVEDGTSEDGSSEDDDRNKEDEVKAQPKLRQVSRDAPVNRTPAKKTKVKQAAGRQPKRTKR